MLSSISWHGWPVLGTPIGPLSWNVSRPQRLPATSSSCFELWPLTDVVWFVANAHDGRIFVCGSSKGMGEGVETALIDVAMDKGNLDYETAVQFWEGKKISWKDGFHVLFTLLRYRFTN